MVGEGQPATVSQGTPETTFARYQIRAVKRLGILMLCGGSEVYQERIPWVMKGEYVGWPPHAAAMALTTRSPCHGGDSQSRGR